MISIDIIEKEIAEIEATKDTTYTTCGKLADLIICRDYLLQKQTPNAGNPNTGESDFMRCACKCNSVELWAVLDELMETVRILQPRVYSAVISKLQAS